MPTIVDQALAVRQWDFSETSQTVSLFCREQGLLRGIAKGARREKGRFSGGIDLLTRGEVVAIVKPGRDLSILTDWDLQEVFRGARSAYRLHVAELYVLDLVHHMITDLDPHPALWDQTLLALRTIDEERDVASALVRFQWAALAETGSQPNLLPLRSEEGVDVFGLDPAAGCLVDDPGDKATEQGPWRVRRETVDMLRSISAGGLGEGEAETSARAGRLLGAYIRWRLGREPSTMALAMRLMDGRL